MGRRGARPAASLARQLPGCASGGVADLDARLGELVADAVCRRQLRQARARSRASRRAPTSGSSCSRPMPPVGPVAARSPRRTISDRKVALALSRSGLSSPARTRPAIALSRSSSAPTAVRGSPAPRASTNVPSRSVISSRSGAAERVARPRRAAAGPSSTLRIATSRTSSADRPAARPRAAALSPSIAIVSPDVNRVLRPPTRTVTPPRPAIDPTPASTSRISAVWLSTPSTNTSCGSRASSFCRSAGPRPLAARWRDPAGRDPRASVDPRPPCRSRRPGS